MTTTTSDVRPTATAGRPILQAGERRSERRTSRALILGLSALGAITLGIAAWQVTATNAPTPAQPVPEAAADQWAVLRPGSSVYAQQVPEAPADSLVVLRPGGSVYAQQVPKASADSLVAYQSAGSVHVPTVPRAWR